MYMLWFNFICFKLIIMHYHSQKLKEMQNFLNPRIKPNHNIAFLLSLSLDNRNSYACSQESPDQCGFGTCQYFKVSNGKVFAYS